MRPGKVHVLFLPALFLLWGCASKLGYPAKTVGIPTPVTLCSKFPQNGTIQNTMPFMARDIWNELYKKRFTDVMAGIPASDLQRRLNIQFSNNVGKSPRLFAPSSSEVFNIDVDYSKTKDDPKTYSGFDFTQYRDSIPTQYVLALTCEEWGLIAGQTDTTNGPYVSLTMQLIDKDTNMSLWRYHYQWMEPTAKDANELTHSDQFQHIVEKLIERAVNQYFQWLNFG